MSVTNNKTQLAILHEYLRGTGRSLTERQASKMFNIKNLRARMSELRQAGLVVRTEKTREGFNKYSVSRRDVYGSEASRLAR